MSTRKKWRLKLIPAFIYKTQPSQRKAYEEVERMRERYALGMSRSHHVNVEVDEGNGWRLYETIIFPKRPLDGRESREAGA